MTRTPSLSLAAHALIALFVSTLSLSLFTLSAMPASAHELSVEGTVGATLHIDPNDEPTAASPATLYLDFENSKRAFDPSEYNFLLTISQNGAVVATTSLFQNGEVGNTASFPYTFQQPGNYAISLTAAPKDGDEASTFSFDTHVTPTAAAQKNGFLAFLGVHGGHVLITLLLIGILVVVVGLEKLKERKARKGVSH
ncbi:hypothetical protein BH11PAT2_BH11PAT2_00730 [soil metagenome]